MNKYMYIILFSFVSSLISEDLVVDGQSFTMSGNYNYDNVQIINGGSILIDTSIDNEGRLTINCDSLWIDSSSSILGNDLVLGGIGSPETGGGAGHGGYGGDSNYTNWCGGQGGVPYGEIYELTSGSSGGGGVAGLGGGAVRLNTHYADIQGTISMQGGNANVTQNQGGGTTSSGGGSGGMIFLEVNHLNIEQSYLDVRGGNGGGCTGFCVNGQTCYGGGGSGGRISIISETEINGSSFANLSSGAGYYVDGAPAEDGDLGQYFYERTWLASLTHPNQEKSYYNTSPAFTMNAEGDIEGYFYLLDDSPSTVLNETSDFSSESSVSFDNIDEGTWYFHAVPMNTNFEILYDQKLSYQINIRTQPITISSNTHPNPDYSYSGTNPFFNLEDFDGLDGYYYLFNQNEDDIPDISDDYVSNGSLFFSGLDDGIWWLHVIAQDSAGNISDVSHFRININVCESNVIVNSLGCCADEVLDTFDDCCVQSQIDCFGECGGLGVIDFCGVCNGDNTTCELVTDIDGNNYGTVVIGEQNWMRENLKVTHYSNGDEITSNIDSNQWCDIDYGAYVISDESYIDGFGNTSFQSYSDVFGNLYNWYAVDDERGICPDGWHVPSENDWQQLELYLGLSEIEINSTGWRGVDTGNKLKEEGQEFWSFSNEEGTNLTGYSALGSGLINCWGTPEITSVRQESFYHSSTENGEGAWYRRLHYAYGGIYRGSHYGSGKEDGFSIRCVADDIVISGCTDDIALNYDSEANYDDGTCEYYSGPNWYVSTSGSDQDGNGSIDSPYESIQNAIDMASDSHTIFIYSGTYYENVVSDKDISIIGLENQEITIDGGNNDFPCLEVNSSGDNDSITIENITFTNSSMAGLTINRSNVLVEDCISEYNTGEDYGGGVKVYGGANVIINNSIFRNNTASWGGGVSYQSSSGSINNCIINDNISGNSGVFSGGSNLDINSSAIIRNGRGGSGNNGEGGGINYKAGGGGTIYKTLIAFNDAWTGSAMYFEGVTVDIVSSTIHAHEEHGGYHGVIRINHSDVSINNSVYDVLQGYGQIILGGTSSIDVSYSYIENGQGSISEGSNSSNNNITINWGVGNIDNGPWSNQPPYFQNINEDDFTLRHYSPLIDAGDPGLQSDPDGTIADMGAYPLYQVPGCIDPSAPNFDESATVPDDSCDFEDNLFFMRTNPQTYVENPQLYNVEDNQWYDLADNPTDNTVSGHIKIAYDYEQNRIFNVVGDGTYGYNVSVFYPETGLWEDGPAMIPDYNSFSSHAQNFDLEYDPGSNLLILSSWDPNQLEHIFTYNHATQEWTELTQCGGGFGEHNGHRLDYNPYTGKIYLSKAYSQTAYIYEINVSQSSCTLISQNGVTNYSDASTFVFDSRRNRLLYIESDFSGTPAFENQIGIHEFEGDTTFEIEWYNFTGGSFGTDPRISAVYLPKEDKLLVLMLTGNESAWDGQYFDATPYLYDFESDSWEIGTSFPSQGSTSYGYLDVAYINGKVGCANPVALNSDSEAIINNQDSCAYYNGPSWYVSVDGTDAEGYGSTEFPFASIQYAIDQSNDTDEIYVLAGTFYENINLNGSNISIIGNGSDTTILDGGGIASAISIDSEETNVLLSDFKIINGLGESFFPVNPPLSADYSYTIGAAIHADSETLNLTITNMTIEGNSNGSAISLHNGTYDLNNVIISNNSNNIDLGGALFTIHGSALSIHNSNFNAENIYMNGNSNILSSANESIILGGVVSLVGSNGTLSKSEITDNSSYYFHVGSSSIIKSSLFNSGNLDLINCTISNNTGDAVNDYGLGIYNEGTLNVQNSIIRNVIENDIESGGESYVYYSNINTCYGCNVLDSSINLDPEFTENYNIAPSSPCVDTGNPDLDGDGEDYLTDVDDQDPDGTRLDMGAFYFNQQGCTDPTACNYDESVVYDNGSCEYYNGPSWYVSTIGDDSNCGSELNPYSSIQQAIDSSAENDDIYVSAGTYYENINFNGKSVSLIGENKENTIIDGNNNGIAVELYSNSVVDEFTIQNGTNNNEPWNANGNIDPTDAGGVVILGNQNIISNCIIKDNTNGIVIRSENNSIINCNISNNNNNTNNLVSESYSSGIRVVGGSVIIAKSIISNNNINRYGVFGWGFNEIEIQNSTIINNNITTENGSFIFSNSIFYGDNNYSIDAAWDDPCNISYSLLNGNSSLCYGNGNNNNIFENPQFTDPENGDFTLQSTSPCIDAGDPSSDLDPDNTIADQGAFYFDQIDFPIILGCMDENALNYNPEATVDDGSCEYDTYVNTLGSDELGNGTIQYPYQTIQKGIDSVTDGGTVFVAPGIYYENINFNGKNISVIGEDKETTIIDGGQNDVVVRIENGESEEALLENFTIRNGGGPPIDVNGGRDVTGGILVNNSEPHFRNLIISNNNCNQCKALSVIGAEQLGFNPSPSFSNIEISDNSCYAEEAINENGANTNYSNCVGTAIYSYNATSDFEDVIVKNNISGSTTQGNTYGDKSIIYIGFWNNPTSYDKSVIFKKSEISNNECIGEWSNHYSDGCAIVLDNAPIKLEKTLISSNSGYKWSGIYIYNKVKLEIINSTILNNSSAWGDNGSNFYYNDSDSMFPIGSDAWNPQLSIENSIIWNVNTSDSGFAWHPDANTEEWEIQFLELVDYSIIQNMTENSVDPQFSDPENGDYSLQFTSPCIDAGNPDLDGDESDYTSDTDDQDPDGTRLDIGAFYFDQIEFPIIYGCMDPGADNYNPDANIDDYLQCTFSGPSYHVSNSGSDFFGIGTELNPFMTIERAIDLAQDSDSILVASGTYYENLIITKNVVLIGENKETTIIDGSEEGSVIDINSDVIIKNFTIENGYARQIDGHGGGGIYIHGSGSPIVEDNIIQNNKAIPDSNTEYDGGGILINTNTESSNSIIRNNIIRNNQAFPGGGGICVFVSGPNTIIERNLIINNELVIYNGGTGSLGENGGGVRLQNYQYSGPVFINNTLWGNSSWGENNDIVALNDAVVKNNIIGFNSPQTSVDLDYNFIANTTSNTPLFVDISDENFHLQWGSPCIDSGDFDSGPDPDGTRMDMGAFPFYQIPGCMDTQACNYNAEAYQDDDSCIFCFNDDCINYSSDYYDCNAVCLNNFDSDEFCDELDSDIENDQIDNDLDFNDYDPYTCIDTDLDGCDDCSSGTFDTLLDGDDSDGDGLCNEGDPYPFCVSNFVDECDVCDGDNTSCMDECGVPNGYNLSCSDDCDIPNGDSFFNEEGYLSNGSCDCNEMLDFDLCMECGGENDCIPKVISMIEENTIMFSQPNMFIEFSVPIDEGSIDNISVSSELSNNLNYQLSISGPILTISFDGLISMDTIDILFPSDGILSNDGYAMNLDGSGDLTYQFNVQMFGDYDNDGDLDSNDVNEFLTLWQDDDLSGELGPFTGTAPNLVENFDGEFNIQDIVAFIYMWDWYNSQNAVSAMNVSGYNNDVEFMIENDILSVDLSGFENIMSVKLQVIDQETSFEDLDLNNQFDIVLKASNLDQGIKELNLGRINLDLGIHNLNLYRLSSSQRQTLEIRYKIINNYGDILADGATLMEYEPIPEVYHLYAAYPNPFNPSTTIKFDISENSYIKLYIYDIKGRLVEILYDGYINAGYHELIWNASTNAAGIYMIKLLSDDNILSQKITLIK